MRPWAGGEPAAQAGVGRVGWRCFDALGARGGDVGQPGHAALEVGLPLFQGAEVGPTVHGGGAAAAGWAGKTMTATASTKSTSSSGGRRRSPRATRPGHAHHRSVLRRLSRFGGAGRRRVEVVEQVGDPGHVDPDLLDAAVDVAHDELAEAESGRGLGVRLGQRGEHGLVAVVDRYPQQAQRLGGDLLVLGDAADEHGGDQVLHVQAEDVARVLGGDQGREVPFAGVPGEPDEEGPAGPPPLHEVRLVEADELARLHRAAVAAAHGQPVGGVQHGQGQLLLGRPVLALDLEVGQAQPGHGDDGQHGLVGEDSGRRGAEEQHRQRHLGGVQQQVPEFLGFGVGGTLQAGDDVVDGGGLLGRHRPHRVAQRGGGGRLPRDLRWHQHRADVLDEHPPLGPGVGDRDAELLVAGGSGRVVLPLRGGDQRVRGEGALFGSGEVEYAGERAQLRHLAEPGQRSGRVEQGDLDSAAGGEVAERTEQCGLATAGFGHEDGEAGTLPYLHREVQVEEDRAPGGAGRPSDEVTATIAHSGRRLRYGGREQLDRHPSQVPGVGERLAGDELPGEGILALGVLQRDAQLALVELDDAPAALEALLPVGPGDGQAVPAVHPGRVQRKPGGHLVAEDQSALGQPLELGRRVHAVFGVVELLGPDHAQPVFEVAEAVARSEDVHSGRDLHRPGQPLVEVQPRLVPFGDLQRLHPADGQHGHVPFLAGEPVDQPGGRPVRGAEALDLLGEGEDVAALPLAPRAAGGEHGGGCHAQRHRSVQQPFELDRRGPPAAHAERAEHLVELLHGPGPPLAFGLAGAGAAEQSADPFGERVPEGAPGERDAEEGLPLRVVHRQQVPLGADEVVAPAGRAGYVRQRVSGVVVDPAGPFVDGEWSGRAPQVQPEPGQPGVLLGHRDDHAFAVGVGPERPAHLGQRVPGGDRGVGEGQVPGDLGDREFDDRVAVLVLGRLRLRYGRRGRPAPRRWPGGPPGAVRGAEGEAGEARAVRGWRSGRVGEARAAGARAAAG